MKLYHHKKFKANTLIYQDLLFYLTYSPTFKMKFCGKIDQAKYNPSGTLQRLSSQQKALYLKLISINYPNLIETM